MPANFNVYTAKNPSPIQYKPATPVYAPHYPPAPAVNYGLNYEHNKLPVYPVPQSYLVPPAVSYPPLPSYMPALVNPEAPKPEASKANETEKVDEAVDPKADPPIDPVDASKPPVLTIANEAPVVKPVDKPDKKIPGKPTKLAVVDPTKPPPPPAPITPKHHPIGKSQRFTDSRVTGYRYIAQPNRRRSTLSMYAQASPARGHQQYYRSASPYQAASPNPYPPSVSYSDSANQTTGYRRGAYAYGSPHKAAYPGKVAFKLNVGIGLLSPISCTN